MKRLLAMGITLFLLFALASCGEHRGDPTQTSGTIPATGETRASEPHSMSNPLSSEELDPCITEPTLDFSSLGELIETRKSARTGKSTGELAESVDFTELERIYLPISLPEPFRLNSISVYKEGVSLRYFREEDLVSEHTIRDAINNMRYFTFAFTRPDSDSTMDILMQHYGITEEGLIDGKYLFREPYMLYWELDGRLMSLKVPVTLGVLVNEISLIDYLGLNSIEELARFTELEVIDLTGLVD